MSEPFLAHSEISNEIYIICGRNKYPVTEQVISAMKATGRLNERPQGDWILIDDVTDPLDHLNRHKCSACGRIIRVYDGQTLSDYPFCHCGADMRGCRE